MIAKVRKFFQPETQTQQLHRTVGILSGAIAVCFVSLLLYEFNRLPATGNTVDKIGLLILLDDIR